MKNWNLISICFIVFIIGACAPKAKLKINIDEDKLVDIMFDVRVAEQLLIKEAPAKRDSLRIHLRKGMEKIHGIAYSEIELNLIELQKDPILMDRLNSALQEKIKAYESKIK